MLRDQHGTKGVLQDIIVFEINIAFRGVIECKPPFAVTAKKSLGGGFRMAAYNISKIVKDVTKSCLEFLTRS